MAPLIGKSSSLAVQELGALGGELTRGVRSTAALASMAEAGVKGGLAAADAAVKGHVAPALARAEKEARGAACTRSALVPDRDRDCGSDAHMQCHLWT